MLDNRCRSESLSTVGKIARSHNVPMTVRGLPRRSGEQRNLHFDRTTDRWETVRAE
jgi:hypothetical protein